ncbi:uncharacterized protein LOC128092892 [Culex pipiens pallens]|uniref:uncharacterized protein LOC128092892 n=1 Tax=Culex pipiens pallens TaxID=42434 RepID=UPI0022AA8D01|nr:uncharacterized protein LOC128092892 [Culex pipiens pallens]
MDGARCSVKISGAMSDPIESRKGLRQGDGISGLCFNIGLEGVMRRAGFNMRGTIINRSSQFICYADDMDIVGRTFEDVARRYTELKREADKVGLKVNVAKTKYLLAGGTESLRTRIGPSVTIDGDEFEVVEEFVYLGSLVTSDNNCSREIRRRIITGSRAYYGLHKTLRSGHLSRRTKYTMYETLIRPVVLYGHETWTMLEEDLQALEVFERRVLPVKIMTVLNLSHQPTKSGASKNGRLINRLSLDAFCLQNGLSEKICNFRRQRKQMNYAVKLITCCRNPSKDAVAKSGRNCQEF